MVIILHFSNVDYWWNIKTVPGWASTQLVSSPFTLLFVLSYQQIKCWSVRVKILLHISSLHDAKPGSDRRTYIEELSGTVMFEILDCVDNMVPLFIKEDREAFLTGLVEACLNFVLPTVPLLTLLHSKFEHAKLPQSLIMIYKIILAYIVNLPLLVMRMILWHGLDHGVSIFSLKNVIVIAMISYDFYEHHETVMDNLEEKHKDHRTENGDESLPADAYGLEDRYDYK
ncbi:uncharacterized protein LOC134248375 [Saccostrea cucullata]|uniref:uncharacterized protein LOC134248375 n=1 Tax=Saccostrea cuccullata TaxID=36930 RepID=UPI002ED31DF2